MDDFNLIEAVKIYLNIKDDSIYDTVEFRDDGLGIYIATWNRTEPQPAIDVLKTLYTNNLRDVWLRNVVRPYRNKLLTDSDFLVIRHRDQEDSVSQGLLSNTTLTADEYKQLLEYRTALRNLTDTIQVSDSPDYPTKPFTF